MIIAAGRGARSANRWTERTRAVDTPADNPRAIA